MRVTFLGTGTSRGVPVIGCSCRVCISANPKNKRLRSSLLIEADVAVVIDTSADFRQQMLRSGLGRLDAVVFTHHHMDHILGLDDLYPFCLRNDKAMPIYAGTHTLEELKMTFRHLFSEQQYPGVARLVPKVIDGKFNIGSLEFAPIDVLHGNLPVLGYRIGDFAYLTDVNHIPRASMDRLAHLDCLVLDGLRFRKHQTHFSLDEAIEVAWQLQPRRTFLIHLCHDVDHEEGNAYLPGGISLAYDGLVLEVD